MPKYHIFQAVNGIAETIKLPNISEVEILASNGKSNKMSGQETSCKFVIRDFSSNDPDIIDLSAFPGK